MQLATTCNVQNAALIGQLVSHHTRQTSSDTQFCRCWICRRIGSTEPRCSRPDSSTDAKQLLPTVTAAVAELDKKLHALQPRQLSQVVAVKESILGLTLSNLAAADIVVTAGCAASVIPGWSWSLGDVIISCNGLPVQSSADFRRALQFSDTCAALVLVPAASVDQKAPLSAGWTLTHLSSGIVQYENTHNRHISYVHPQLLMKETVPVHITLNSYQNGQYCTPSSHRFVVSCLLPLLPCQ